MWGDRFELEMNQSAPPAGRSQQGEQVGAVDSHVIWRGDMQNELGAGGSVGCEHEARQSPWAVLFQCEARPRGRLKSQSADELASSAQDQREDRQRGLSR